VRARAGALLAAVAAAFILHLVVVRFPRCSHGVALAALSLQAASERIDGGFGCCELPFKAIEGLVTAP
jgi:hypothetical protein